MIHSRYKHVLSYVKSEVLEVCWFAVNSVKGEKMNITDSKKFKSKFKKIRKNFISIMLGVSLCVSLTSCGKGNVMVEDYGDNSASSTASATTGDAATATDVVEQGEGRDLRQMFGERIDWEESFSIANKTIDVDTYYSVPADSYMNVMKCKAMTYDSAWEESVVKAIFGDTAEKIEELTYKGETEYMPFLYKYRYLLNSMTTNTGIDEEIETGPEYLQKSYSIITSSYFDETEEKFTWRDTETYHIHMYEGTYEEKRFGLLMGYDSITATRYIFFNPLNIYDYFPGTNYETMLIESTNDKIGSAREFDNACDMSMEEVEKEASDFLEEKLKISSTNNKITPDSRIYTLLDQQTVAFSASNYMSELYDMGPSVISFTDTDYMSCLKDGRQGVIESYQILSEQQDLARDAYEEKGQDIYDFIYTGSSAGVVEGTKTYDGYAVFLDNQIFNYSTLLNSFEGIEVNTGMITFTSQGIYGADISLNSEMYDMVEGVNLLDFDQIQEAFKSELNTKFDPSKMGSPQKLSMINMDLVYYAKEDGAELTYIPCWRFMIMGEFNGNHMAIVNINAMDGTLEDLYYVNYDE